MRKTARPVRVCAAALLVAGCTSPTVAPGARVAVSTSSPTPTSTSTSTSSPGTHPAGHGGTAAAVPLHGHGVGAVYLGTPEREARAALADLLGPPEDERTSSCPLHETEAESEDRTLVWGDLLVGLETSRTGELALGSWSVRGPDVPAAVTLPYGIRPGVDTAADLLAVEGVARDEEREAQLGPGFFSRGALVWDVELPEGDEQPEPADQAVGGVSVGLDTCD